MVNSSQLSKLSSWVNLAKKSPLLQKSPLDDSVVDEMRCFKPLFQDRTREQAQGGDGGVGFRPVGENIGRVKRLRRELGSKEEGKSEDSQEELEGDRKRSRSE